MFKTRFISGAVLTLLTIGILYLGGYVTGVAVFFFCLKNNPWGKNRHNVQKEVQY